MLHARVRVDRSFARPHDPTTFLGFSQSGVSDSVRRHVEGTTWMHRRSTSFSLLDPRNDLPFQPNGFECVSSSFHPPHAMGQSLPPEPSGSTRSPPSTQRERATGAGDRVADGVDKTAAKETSRSSAGHTFRTRISHARARTKKAAREMAQAAASQTFVRHAVRRTARRGCVRTRAAVAVPSKVRRTFETHENSTQVQRKGGESKRLRDS